MQLWKENHAHLSWPDINEKKVAIKAFWFMLHRTKKECLPPREWDGHEAKVGWGWSHNGAFLSHWFGQNCHLHLKQDLPQRTRHFPTSAFKQVCIHTSFHNYKNCLRLLLKESSVPVWAQSLVQDLHIKRSWLHWFEKLLTISEKSVQIPTGPLQFPKQWLLSTDQKGNMQLPAVGLLISEET